MTTKTVTLTEAQLELALYYAYVAGFESTGEGYNGEYASDKNLASMRLDAEKNAKRVVTDISAVQP